VPSWDAVGHRLSQKRSSLVAGDLREFDGVSLKRFTPDGSARIYNQIACIGTMYLCYYLIVPNLTNEGRDQGLVHFKTANECTDRLPDC
jgi:hypothetical protein